jgi:hypothetical protein
MCDSRRGENMKYSDDEEDKESELTFDFWSENESEFWIFVEDSADHF